MLLYRVFWSYCVVYVRWIDASVSQNHSTSLFENLEWIRDWTQGKNIQNIHNQQFLFFMTIELGVFPTYCGILIDLLTLPVLGDSLSWTARMSFLERHRGVWTFLHCMVSKHTMSYKTGVIGTTFMFQFATYVTLIRSVIRPGVLWFIRDPNDPRFQPLNDILERPFLVQLKKLSVGVMLYTTIIISSVGGLMGVCLGIEKLLGHKRGPFKVFPLRWDYKYVFIDLLISI